MEKFSRQRCLDPDPVCPEMLDPDPTPDPDSVNIRPDPKPWSQVHFYFVNTYG